MKIELITMWYNEEFLSPFFLNHYAWVDRIHLILDSDTNDRTEEIALRYPNVVIHRFTFPDMLDDILKSAVISSTYLEITDADYVIVVDSDEFIFSADFITPVREHLASTDRDIYFVNLWHICKHESEGELDPALPVYQQRRYGMPSDLPLLSRAYLKPAVVRGGLKLFWGIGNHYVMYKESLVEWDRLDRKSLDNLNVAADKSDMLYGAHWRLVDFQETIRRRISNRRMRMSRENLERGHGAHFYEVTEEEIVREFEENKSNPAIFR